MKENIFVAIAGVRGEACAHAIEALKSRAKYPERLSFSAAYLEGEFSLESQGNIRQRCVKTPSHTTDKQGFSFLWHEAHQALEDEIYFLNLAASVRLTQDWDELLIDELNRCDSKRPAITMMPLGGEESELRACHAIPVTRVTLNGFSRQADPACVQLNLRYVAPEDEVFAGPYPTPFAMVECLFAPAQLLREVPLDAKLPYRAQALAYGARLWTHGYDLFQPSQILAFQQGLLAADPLERELFPHKGMTTLQMARRVRHLLALDFCEDEKVLAGLEDVSHGDMRDLQELWQCYGIDWDSQLIAANAQSGEWLKLRQGESAEMQPAPSKDRIFVQIASYRDPDCQHTLVDIFAKAKHPERIFVGLFWQFVEGEDDDCFELPTPHPSQVRTLKIDAANGKGVCWARHITQSIWGGEEFTLQIDAHMRFEPGWDETLLQMQRQCGKEKAVIASYPPGFTPPDHLERDYIFGIYAKEFNQDGIFTMIGQPCRAEEAPQKPPPGAFVSGGLLFGPAQMIRDVPYDPHLYFFGEEISLSARLWTSGYDIFYPNDRVAYHDWNREGRKNTHFSDHDDWSKRHIRAVQRVKYLLGRTPPEDPDALVDINRYGLGDVRTLSAYETFCGVNFITQEVHENAKKGIFPVDSAYQAIAQQAATKRPKQSHKKMASGVAIKAPAQPAASRGGHMNIATDNSEHEPFISYQSDNLMVVDNFLPQQTYEALYEYSVLTDYKHINTQGQVSRVWTLDNGFPLRSMNESFYYATNRPEPKPDWAYPTGKGYDDFAENLWDYIPKVQHLIGKPKQDWQHFSINGWLYPPHTGLSLHCDGYDQYSGAYVFFLNPLWRIHWGGLLLVMDQMANQRIAKRFEEPDIVEFCRKKWLHVSEHDEMIMESGFAQCVLPKANRIVFIEPGTFHMVTKVLPNAGDNVRSSLAGFFCLTPK